MEIRDVITHIGSGSVIQHGKHSDRIYLMKLAVQDSETIAGELIRLAKKHQYSKIFCKIPKSNAPLFFAEGYILEGCIPNYYNGVEEMYCVSKFLTTERLSVIQQSSFANFHQLLLIPTPRVPASEDGYSFRRLRLSDVESMTKIYCDIFESYPFPIYDPVYIAQTMEENVQYFGAFIDGCLVALASSEVDFESKNAEMTDFATDKAHTGHRLASGLLEIMEQQMRQQGILTLYSIVRLNSIPMNKTFLRLGYKYSGTLINNTQISGEIESMNLYFKAVVK